MIVFVIEIEIPKKWSYFFPLKRYHTKMHTEQEPLFLCRVSIVRYPVVNKLTRKNMLNDAFHVV